MKAKEADAAHAARAAPARAAPGPAPQAKATRPGTRDIEFRGEVTCIDGKWKIYCKHKNCQKQVPYTNWSSHCKKDHADKVLNNRDANDANDMNGDAIQPGQRAAGDGDVSKEPRKGYGQRKNDGTHDAKAVDSSNGKAAFKKSKVAPKKKSQPE